MIALNEKQKQAAEFMFGTASVIAVPGSGKTLTMAARIGYLVRSGISPKKILGLTFTRNAAGEMRDKLRPVLGDQTASVTLSTIHSFCHRLLKEEGRRFTILYGKRQIYLISKIIRKLDIGVVPPGIALREISLAKSRLIDYEKYISLHQKDDIMNRVGQVYQVYELEKQKRFMLDFDDLLVEVHGLLKTSEDKRFTYQELYSHILVDEFQDTNPAQMEILNLLARNSDGSSFWVCGDDCQSIFGFTGADVDNILSFGELYPASVQFILDINYRSTPQILKACQDLIDHNQRKIDKTLNTINSDGDKVTVLCAISETDEANSVVAEIMNLVGARGFEYRDIAVLYRANTQSRAFEEAFSKHRIPYRIESESSFYNRFEVNIILNYLRLIHNPDSFDGDEALKAIINIPNRYIGHSFIQDLDSFAEAKGFHLLPALKIFPVGPQYLKQAVDGFIKFIDTLIISKKVMEPVDLIHLIREHLNIDKYLAEETGDVVEESLENLDQLQTTAGNYEDLGDFLDHVHAVSSHSFHNENGVTLSTVHKAKGLEFPVVFVIGMVEGIMPNVKGDLEEERRIAFVAMSRAMKKLYLSYPLSYQGRTAQKSSFIIEAINERR